MVGRRAVLSRDGDGMVCCVVVRFVAGVVEAVFGGKFFFAEPRVEQCQVVMRRDVFCIDLQRLLELFDGLPQQRVARLPAVGTDLLFAWSNSVIPSRLMIS